MMNLAYLTRQLKLAADCIQRGLDIVEAEAPAGDAPQGPTREGLRDALAADGLAELHGTHRPSDRCTLPPPGWTCSRAAGHDGPCAAAASPVAAGSQPPPGEVAMRLGRHLEERVILLAGTLKAFTDRTEQLAKILLDIAPDACARHDLFGF